MISLLRFYYRLAICAAIIVTSQAAYSQAVPELMYYKFDMPGTTVANDASSPVGNNPATVTGLTIGGTGQFGTGLQGNAGATASNRVDPGWTGTHTSSWTISFWMDVPAPPTTRYMFGNTSGNGTFRCFIGGAANTIRLTGGVPSMTLDMPSWVSGVSVIHYVYDQTAGTVSGYINGVFQTSVTVGTSYPLVGTNFVVGSQGTSIDGIMDEFRMYNRALSASEISGTWNITLPGGPCTSPPTAGTTTISNYTPCSGQTISLSLLGNSFGTGQTYQWETASSISGPWIPEGSSGSNATLTGVLPPVGKTYYRCQVTCGASTVPSNIDSVIVATPFPGGVYTINSATPTGGSNFQSFTDVMTAIGCGIAGPIVLNVAPGSGPYTEQIIMPNTLGSNSTNTVTINGNGATVQYTATGASTGILMMDGVDYVKIDSLVFKSLDATNGSGAILYNGCDFDSITRCTFDISSVTATASSNAGIRISATPTSTSTTVSGASNTYIANCEIIGNATGNNGIYYGLYAYGPNTNNVYHNNTITNAYLYSLYVYYGDLNVISNNFITRQTKTGTGYCYGLYANSLTGGSQIVRNRIEYLGGAADNSSYCYPLQVISSVGTSTAPVLVANNIIGNMTSVPLYGLYINGGSYVDVFHNTVSIDLPLTYSTTTNQSGIYSSSGTANILNNIVSYTGGGPNTKYGIYLSSAPASCNYNNIYMNSSVSGTQYYGYSGSAYATFAAFQGGTTFEVNGLSLDPLYQNAANSDFEPTEASLDNMGTPVASVTSDINGTPRDPNTPDMGAIEFTVPACSAPPTPGTVVASATHVCFGQTVDLNLTGNSIGIGQTYQWESTTSLSSPWMLEGSAAASPAYTATPVTTGMIYYRCAVTCGASTVYSDTVSVNVPAPFPGGTYTINSAVPTGGTNFQSFTDAMQAMGCGVAGPIVLDVTPGSGPYNEQVILPKTLGTDAVNTLKINGNGATVQFSPSTPYTGILMMDSVSYVKIDSLVFKSLSTSYGFGAMLYNGCDYDSITRCIFDLTSVSATASADCGGLRITATASTTSSTVTGASNTYIGSCQFLGTSGSGGPYNGFYCYGPNTNNVYHNNLIADYYYYGAYDYYGDAVTYSNNTFTRQGKTSGATGGYYGFYLANSTGGSKVVNNKVIYTGGAANNGSYSYPFNIMTCSGNSTTPVLVANNVIANNTASPYYGMRISGGNYINVYHNTVSIDEVVAYTNANYGIYTTSSPGNCNIQNNIINITGGGTSTKYGLYYGSMPATSDYNNVYVNSTQGGTQAFGYSGSAQTNLSAWQGTTSKDALSHDYNPMLVQLNGVPTPTSAALDNLGFYVGVDEDILGALRNISAPDMGAVEFVPPSCPSPSGLGATNITTTSADLTWTQHSTATQWQIEYAPSTGAFTLGTGIRTASTTNPHPLTGLAQGTPYAYYVRDICSVGDTSYWSGPYTFFTSFPAVPPNDDCMTPVDISNGALYYGSNAGATQTLAPCDATSTSATDVWYTFTTGSTAGVVNDSVNTSFSGGDVVVQLYSGTCGSLTPVIPTAGTTFNTTTGCVDGPAAGMEWSSYSLAANTTYFIRVYSFGTTVPGPFSIQISGTPLAIKLDKFTATNIGKANRVDWNTLSEEQGDRFELQKSIDGKNFITIYEQRANGAASRYTYLDNDAAKGQNYYRLLMVAANGGTTYSKTVSAFVNSNGFEVEAFPNPVSHELTVKVSGVQGANAAVQVTDVTGKVVKTVKMDASMKTINMSGLTNGIYLIKYSDDSHTQTIKVNKQ